MISDEAVEAVALALFERDYGVGDWGITNEQVKAAYLDEARTALAAAAPHMLADAASRPATQQIGTLPAEYQPNKPYSPNTADVITTNPYRSQA